MATEPVTPKKKDGPELYLKDVNEKYNLGILFPTEPATPKASQILAQRDPRYKRHSSISGLVRYLFFSNRVVLDQVIKDFEEEARVICRNWVRKTRNDRDLLPRSPKLPQASSHHQQEELQTKLLTLLETSKTTGHVTRSITAALRSSISATSPQKIPSPAPRTRSAKRRSEGGTLQDGITKRSKGAGNAENSPPPDVNTATDHVAMLSKVNGPDLLFAPRARPLSRNHSSSTSRASFHSKVFSEDGDDALQDSQITVPATSQEEKRALEIRRIPRADEAFCIDSQSSYSASPATNQAIFESFRALRSSSTRGATNHHPIYSGLPQLADLPDRDRGAWDSPMVDADIDISWSEGTAIPSQLERRLKDIWPQCPSWLLPAPFPVIWELTRAALHCGVDLQETEPLLISKDVWEDQGELRKALWNHPSFQRKALPEFTSPNVWEAALKAIGTGQSVSSLETVVYSASMDFSPSKDGDEPLYRLKLQAIKLDQPCRLTRRFGSDRFLEILLPSCNSQSSPVKDEKAVKSLVKWLTRTRHPLAGRLWRTFFTKDGGYRRPATEYRLGPEPKAIWKDRIYLFAEADLGPRKVPSETVESMLQWLLQLDREGSHRQPFLKLFSRIALGLSRTTPTVTFDVSQIRRRKSDLLSPTGKVMNDGIGRMSLIVARKIRDILGLKDIPSAVQGRLGSAKGMWIIDVMDLGQEVWIETYPSQEKWDCDFLDIMHRTLEVRSHANEVRSARLNLQLLPVLEDRAIDRQRMRTVIGELLERNLNQLFEGQKLSMSHPLQFRQWVQENSFSSMRPERVLHNGIPFTGGLPSRDEDTIAFLLDAGFDPRRQKYLQTMAWDLQKLRCESLKEKMNVPVGRSAYMYMVVDFLGVLQENEVAVCFSSKFRDEESQFSDLFLDKLDVLVARSPAHFASDIQRVKAVFRPELRALQDVIIFPSKGNAPLADKLSGGDYDGDLAWVCWDPRMVQNFENADVPEKPDLFRDGYLRKRRGTMKDLQTLHGSNAVAEMIEQSFEFNMRENFLGRCTNYKERMTYKRGEINDHAANMLSELVSNLVDQAKQGIEFTTRDWIRLLKHIGEDPVLPDPAYKSANWSGRSKPKHVIDHLKFDIAKPAIENQLRAFHVAMNPSADRSPSKHTLNDPQEAHHFDEDLVRPAKHLKVLANGSNSMTELYNALVRDIHRVKEGTWDRLMVSERERDEMTYPQRLQVVYDVWCAITPETKNSKALDNSKTVAILWPPHLRDKFHNDDYTSWGLYAKDPENSPWALYRASLTFQLYYKKSPKFAFQIAGRQLAKIKAESGPGPIGVVTRSMYGALKLDTTTAKQMVARLAGQGSLYHDDGLNEDDNDWHADDDA